MLRLPGHGPILGLAAALLLGVRHATDPDHLTAVSTLVLSEDRAPGRAGLLGLFWGLGHATMLLLVGMPLIFLGGALPGSVHRAAEVAVGVLIAALAVRLLVRWRRGAFHVHPHAHEGVWHAHPHGHERAHEALHGDASVGDHRHPHAEGLGRSPLASYGIGLVHGVGGTAGVGVLLAASLPVRFEAALAVTLFALGTAVSMACLSLLIGHALNREGIARHLAYLTPFVGVMALVFGVWYALAALGQPATGV